MSCIIKGVHDQEEKKTILTRTQRKWFLRGRFRLPFWGHRIYHYIPQPHWLKRWYYKMSIKWWGHPSNHHWKGWCILSISIKQLLPGERDLWTGSYMLPNISSTRYETLLRESREKIDIQQTEKEFEREYLVRPWEA